MTKKDLFGEEYFGGGSGKPGYYQRPYDFNRLYPSFEFTAAQIKKYFNPKTVLNIGSAKGFLVYAFQNFGIDACGVDISGYAISNAPSKIRAYLYKRDFEKDNLPFNDGYFDFITFFATIEYLQDHQHILQEISRILKCGGIVYLKTCAKSMREDVRINVHKKAFWINEFKRKGFKFIQSDIISSLLIHEIQRNFTPSRPNPTIKFKIGKILYKTGGIGNYILSRILSRRYHDLLFTKA